jgi:UDP-N-acetylglucosamine 2-epimerase (non-hydrolysing)
MVDTLFRLLTQARALNVPERLGVSGGPYAFVTLHRPSNVDHLETLRQLLMGLERLGQQMPVLFAVHPRTRRRIDEFGLADVAGSVRLLDPIGYLETVSLVDGCRLVVTDSGGLQEETTALGVPCLTVRPNTERPVTVMEGTNRLVESTEAALGQAVEDVLATSHKGGAARRPALWDGRAGHRVVEALLSASLPSGALVP